jgi:hypothetical protein
LELVGQLAEGLAAVHAAGLLHRDLKPSNVLVGDDGRPRLIDFGLAATLASDDLHVLSGTLAYMAPEQAAGLVERIDARSDIYGLGAVLYELLTGRPPHQAPSARELWQAAREGEVVAPRTRNPRVPLAVNALCLRCLARDPAARFASAAELAAAVRRLQRRRTGRQALVGVAAAVLLLGTALLLWAMRPRAGPTPSPDRSTDAPTVEAVPPRLLAFLPQDDRPLRRDFVVRAEFDTKAKDAEGRFLLDDGDRVTLRVTTERDCYLGVWVVDAARTIVRVFPNRFEDSALVRAGETVLVPGRPEYALQASASTGTEYVYVLASTRPLPAPAGLRGGVGKDGAFLLEGEADMLQTRGLTLTPTEQTAEEILPFFVRPRR